MVFLSPSVGRKATLLSALNSLRTTILTQLCLLVMAGMMLINGAMIKLSERDMIGAKAHLGGVVLQAIEQRVAPELADQDGFVRLPERAIELRGEISRLLKASGFTDALIVDREGSKFIGIGARGAFDAALTPSAREALVSREGRETFQGTTWGVIWLAHETIQLSAPLFHRGSLQGAMAISAPLSPLYEDLRNSQRIALIYLLLNTVLLVFFGGHLLSRTVIKPIQRLLKITESFKEGEPFALASDSATNEFGRLHRSLTMMLKRLDENREQLKQNVLSLERANQEIRTAQTSLIRTEKLACVGRLAAGVAHEIGNPIGIVLGYVGLIRRGDLTEKDRLEYAARIESEVTRISRIIRQMLDFSRPVQGKKERVSVHRMIHDAVEMMAPQPMVRHMEMKTSLAATRDLVLVDPGQFKQVLLNIIINAADAISGNGQLGGCLTIATHSSEKEVELRLTDNGPGISEQDIPKIFDPFYTTKEPGKGTGLGLSVCHSIVEGWGGKIRGESLQGKGATIVFTIPLDGEGYQP
jgi:two-component system NtrC family sensor kinase